MSNVGIHSHIPKLLRWRSGLKHIGKLGIRMRIMCLTPSWECMESCRGHTKLSKRRSAVEMIQLQYLCSGVSLLLSSTYPIFAVPSLHFTFNVCFFCVHVTVNINCIRYTKEKVICYQLELRKWHADVSTECFSCHQGKSEEVWTNSANYSHALLRIHNIGGQRSVGMLLPPCLLITAVKMTPSEERFNQDGELEVPGCWTTVMSNNIGSLKNCNDQTSKLCVKNWKASCTSKPHLVLGKHFIQSL